MNINNSAHSEQRCLVLGGKGFIGSHLVRRLKDLGYMVRVFDRPANCGDKTVEVENGVEFYKGDFVNSSDLKNALEGVQYVFHLISTTTPKSSNDNPIYDIETNLVGTLKLLEIVKTKKDIKIVFLSSGGTVYGLSNSYPIPETHPTKPICSYGLCKLTIENYLYTYNYLYNIDYVILRASNPYGENQNPKSIQGAVSVFMYKILMNQKIAIWGDGNIARDFIYINDVIDAIEIAMQKKLKHNIFNIGSGVATSLTELIKILCNITGCDPIVEHQPGRGLDVPVNFLDISLARSELDWTPKTPLANGLKKTWDWMRIHYSL